jgi:hypothetical protein
MDCYHDTRLSETIDHLRHARELAAAAGTEALEHESRFWEGAALHGAGRLREALAAWAPALTGEVGVLSDSRYMALTRYLLVAIDMPLPVRLIEQALDQTEEILRSSGGDSFRRSRVLLARARLALACGRHDDGFAFAQEAAERCKEEPRRYTYSSYFRTFGHAGLLVNEPDLVEQYLIEWECIEWAYPHTKRLLLLAARANLARYRGDHDEALTEAERGITQALHSEEVVYATETMVAHVRACLAAGVPDQARRSLAWLLARRRCSIGEVEYEVRLLLGDYHLACLALSARGSAIDPEWGTSRAVPPDRRAPVSAADHWRLARRSYGGAACVGAGLDVLLCTSHRGRAVEDRLATLEGLGVDAGPAMGPEQ